MSEENLLKRIHEGKTRTVVAAIYQVAEREHLQPSEVLAMLHTRLCLQSS